MAEQENQDEKKKSGKSGLVKMVIVGAAAVAGGVATPLIIASMSGENSQGLQVTRTSGPVIPDAGEKSTFIEFDEIVANINEARFNRYLKLSLTLQIAESQKTEIEKLIEEKRAVLKNWLYGHLADKSLKDLEGKNGQNRLRREIHDYFNMTLFEDGIERIQDVLFKDYNIQ